VEARRGDAEGAGPQWRRDVLRAERRWKATGRAEDRGGQGQGPGGAGGARGWAGAGARQAHRCRGGGWELLALGEVQEA
jgi:hypothetical protein